MKKKEDEKDEEEKNALITGTYTEGGRKGKKEGKERVQRVKGKGSGDGGSIVHQHLWFLFPVTGRSGFTQPLTSSPTRRDP